MHADTETVANIAAEIDRYLEAHPQAADSVEGIRQWWLTALGPQRSALVEAALGHLLVRGIVVREVMPDGTVLYGRAATTEAHDE